MEISGNGQNYSPSPNTFLYQPDVIVTLVRPTVALANAPTVISIAGQNFINSSSLLCSFGGDIASCLCEHKLITCTTPRRLRAPSH